MTTFFNEEDYRVYLRHMKKHCEIERVVIQAYCLMPNHVHLIAVPETVDGLRRAVGEAHRRYTCCINQRKDWRGYLWQGRFYSVVMDEDHFLTAMRYIELNPVRAGLVASPREWPWSSARAHLTGSPDPLLANIHEMIDYVGDWEKYLALDTQEEDMLRLRQHTRTGRPLGSHTFVRDLEKRFGRPLQKQKTGPKTTVTQFRGHNT